MVYLVLAILIIGLYTIKRKSVMNATFLFAAPYVFIILLNNNVMVDLGYFPINEATFKTLFIYTIGLFIGSVIQLALKQRSIIKLTSSNLDNDINDQSIKKINSFLWLVIITRLIDIVLSIRRVGLAALYADDFNALQLSGIVGHLTLLGMALVPYIFMHYLKNKSKSDLYIIVFFIGILFASFIKYHVIILVIVFFFEYCFFYPQKIMKAFAFLFGFTLALFVGNYWISFLLRSISFSSTFAISKVWTYIAGGTITNDIILKTTQNSYSLGEWMLSNVSGIVNLFSTLLVGKPVINTVDWGYVVIGHTSFQDYWTNVFSILTYMTQYSTVAEMVITALLIGCIGEFTIPEHTTSNDSYTKPTKLFVLSFIFLNFFSNYFCLSSSWEIIGWSMLSGLIVRSLPYLSFEKSRRQTTDYRL